MLLVVFCVVLCCWWWRRAVLLCLCCCVLRSKWQTGRVECVVCCVLCALFAILWSAARSRARGASRWAAAENCAGAPLLFPKWSLWEGRIGPAAGGPLRLAPPFFEPSSFLFSCCCCCWHMCIAGCIASPHQPTPRSPPTKRGCTLTKTQSTKRAAALVKGDCCAQGPGCSPSCSLPSRPALNGPIPGPSHTHAKRTQTGSSRPPSLTPPPTPPPLKRGARSETGIQKSVRP